MQLNSVYWILGATLTVGVLVVLLNTTTRQSAVFCQHSFAQREHAVVMFGTSWCGYCANAREFFAENHIAYCEYDIEASAENHRTFKQLGGDGVPLILVGDQPLHGFFREDLRRALQQLNRL